MCKIDSCPVGSDITVGSRWKGIFYFILYPRCGTAWAGVSCLSSFAGGVLDRDSVYLEIVHSLLFSLCFPSSLLYWLQCNFLSDTYVLLIYSAPMVFLGRAVLTHGPPRPIDWTWWWKCSFWIPLQINHVLRVDYSFPMRCGFMWFSSPIPSESVAPRTGPSGPEIF